MELEGKKFDINDYLMVNKLGIVDITQVSEPDDDGDVDLYAVPKVLLEISGVECYIIFDNVDYLRELIQDRAGGESIPEGIYAFCAALGENNNRYNLIGAVIDNIDEEANAEGGLAIEDIQEKKSFIFPLGVYAGVCLATTMERPTYVEKGVYEQLKKMTDEKNEQPPEDKWDFKNYLYV